MREIGAGRDHGQLSDYFTGYADHEADHPRYSERFQVGQKVGLDEKLGPAGDCRQTVMDRMVENEGLCWKCSWVGPGDAHVLGPVENTKNNCVDPKGFHVHGSEGY